LSLAPVMHCWRYDSGLCVNIAISSSWAKSVHGLFCVAVGYSRRQWHDAMHDDRERAWGRRVFCRFPSHAGTRPSSRCRCCLRNPVASTLSVAFPRVWTSTNSETIRTESCCERRVRQIRAACRCACKHGRQIVCGPRGTRLSCSLLASWQLDH